MPEPKKRRPARRRIRPVLILAAYPRRAAAERAARELVRDRILACATVTPNGRAFYRWKGKEHADPSVILWGKTLASRSRDALRAIRASHPDEVPEILVLPIQGGHGPYLAWLAEEVS
jgi:periplasmic divalent cation tolerance protein